MKWWFWLLVAVVALLLLGIVAARSFNRTRRVAAGQGASPEFAPAPPVVPQPRQYNPAKVGNDASARPWERSSMAFDSAKYGSAQGRAGSGAPASGPHVGKVPAGFDTDSFLAAAKRNFVTLQDAWDHADLKMLRSMMTDRMVSEIRAQLAEREGKGASPNRTEVVLLEAQLLGVEDREGEYLASVEFSGMMREDPSAGPSPFREVWNMSRPKDAATGWLVAGVQALQ
jgi:predicted lipid-binding transport protein (Tim44 family)